MSITFETFIPGNEIDLVVLTRQIAMCSNWFRWFNDPDTTTLMQQHYFPNTEDEQLQFFEREILGNRKKLQLGIVHRTDRQLIGVVSLSSIDQLNRKCEIGGFIGEKTYRTVSYFGEAISRIMVHGFQELNMHRMHGGTLDKNIAELFVRFWGFSHEGVRKEDVWKGGAFRDVYLIGLLRNEFERRAARGLPFMK